MERNHIALSAALLLFTLAVAPARVVAQPLPSGLTAEEANLGPKDRYPFRMDFSFPRYAGVDDPRFMELQVIHHQLLIVGNDYTLQARRRAYESRKAELDVIAGASINKWVKYKKYAALLRESFIATYNEYLNLDEPDFFTVACPDDADYREPKHPEKVTRYCNSRGNFREFHLARERECAAGNYLGNFSYLFLPAPLKEGRVYTITQGDGRRVTFAFHEDVTISRALKVNQSGYLPGAGRKYAYLGAWQAGYGPVKFDAWSGKTFEVVEADSRRVALRGAIRLLARDPKSRMLRHEQRSAGEDVYLLDLSALKTQGAFYLRVKGVGRSWPFLHHQEAYGRAFYIHLRGLFHQRGGHALERAYTAWPRPLAHAAAYLGDYTPTVPYHRPPVDDFNAIRHHVKTNPHPIEWEPRGRGGVGGWYDAADYDRRWFHYHAFWDLILAYELAPRNFTDGQEHTYEAGNGVPDVLDEAAWGLLVWRNSQRENGGVSSRLEAIGHPSSTDMKPDGRPHRDAMYYYFSAPTREGSLRYAGAAAHLARLLKPFDKARAAAWLESARRAWRFGADPANHYQRPNYGGSGKPFREAEQLLTIAECAAGLELYLTTREEAFLERALKLYPKMELDLKWPVKFVRDHYWFAFYDDPAIPAAHQQRARKFYLAAADEREKHTHQRDYRSPIDPASAFGTSWGKATGVYDARYLLMAWGLTRDQKYLDAAAIAADWLQGCNPLGASWTSGIGYNYPWCFFNHESEEDGILDPVPGVTVYGVTGGLPMGVKLAGLNLAHYDREEREYVIDKQLLPRDMRLIGAARTPDVPYWRRWVQDYHDAPALQEYTVWETISPAVLVYGVLMGEGWTPDERLKNMRPRDPAHLFGQWMTP